MTKPICIYGINSLKEFKVAIKYVKSKRWNGGESLVKGYMPRYNAIFDGARFSECGLTKVDLGCFDLEKSSRNYKCIHLSKLGKLDSIGHIKDRLNENIKDQSRIEKEWKANIKEYMKIKIDIGKLK